MLKMEHDLGIIRNAPDFPNQIIRPKQPPKGAREGSISRGLTDEAVRV